MAALEMGSKDASRMYFGWRVAGMDVGIVGTSTKDDLKPWWCSCERRSYNLKYGSFYKENKNDVVSLTQRELNLDF